MVEHNNIKFQQISNRHCMKFKRRSEVRRHVERKCPFGGINKLVPPPLPEDLGVWVKEEAEKRAAGWKCSLV